MNPRRLLLVQCLAGSVIAAGCVAVDGGAIEAAWVINAAARSIRIDCDCARLGAVQLRLEPLGAGTDPCAGNDRCIFDCEGGVGTTGFFVPQASYSMSIVPVDLEGKMLEPRHGVVGPPPTVREVRIGELTDLGVYLLIADQERLAGPAACDPEALEH